MRKSQSRLFSWTVLDFGPVPTQYSKNQFPKGRDDLRSEYQFDYTKARPNPYAAEFQDTQLVLTPRTMNKARVVWAFRRKATT